MTKLSQENIIKQHKSQFVPKNRYDSIVFLCSANLMKKDADFTGF